MTGPRPSPPVRVTAENVERTLRDLGELERGLDFGQGRIIRECIAALAAERDEWMNEARCIQAIRDHDCECGDDEACEWLRRAEAAEAALAVAQDALRGVEWCGHSATGDELCPECEAEIRDGHAEDCSIYAALAVPADTKEPT